MPLFQAIIMPLLDYRLDHAHHVSNPFKKLCSVVIQMVLFRTQSKSEEKVHAVIFLLSAALISLVCVSQPLDTLASRDVAIDTSGSGSASASADGRTISALVKELLSEQ